MPDIAKPIVFPDYLISVNTPPTIIDVPDWLLGIADEITISATKKQISRLRSCRNTIS